MLRARQTRSTESGAARLGLLLGAYLGLASAQCTFPEYDLQSGGASGSETTGGSGSTAGSGSGATPPGGTANGAQGGTSTEPPGGAAGDAGNMPDPECAPEQWPVVRCAQTCLRQFPDHCYDGEATGDETGADCGGSCQGCTNEACEVDEDCLAGSCIASGSEPARCVAALALGYTPHETSVSVAITAWSVTLTNQQAQEAYSFKDLKIRYYFERGGVAEPMLTNGTQSNLKLASGESRAVEGTWSIFREEDRPEHSYDAYVEIGFSEGGQLFPGDRLELYQQLMSGDTAGSNFDQRANYSFVSTPGPSLRITVYYKDQLLWGLAPRPNHPRACFARAVNVNGSALTVSGNSWQSATQAGIVTSGSGTRQATALFPPVPGTLATALETYTRLQEDQELMLPVQNDTYLVYLYAVSPTAESNPSHFTLQGEEPDSSGGFLSQAANGGQAWAKLGPYRLDVTDEQVVIGVRTGSPDLNIAALELWYPE